MTALDALTAFDPTTTSRVGASDDGLLILDEHGIITGCNAVAARIFGAVEKDLLGKEFAVLFDTASIGHDIRNPPATIGNAYYYLSKRLAGTS